MTSDDEKFLNDWSVEIKNEYTAFEISKEDLFCPLNLEQPNEIRFQNNKTTRQLAKLIGSEFSSQLTKHIGGSERREACMSSMVWLLNRLLELPLVPVGGDPQPPVPLITYLDENCGAVDQILSKLQRVYKKKKMPSDSMKCISVTKQEILDWKTLRQLVLEESALKGVYEEREIESELGKRVRKAIVWKGVQDQNKKWKGGQDRVMKYKRYTTIPDEKERCPVKYFPHEFRKVILEVYAYLAEKTIRMCKIRIADFPIKSVDHLFCKFENRKRISDENRLKLKTRYNRLVFKILNPSLASEDERSTPAVIQSISRSAEREELKVLVMMLLNECFQADGSRTGRERISIPWEISSGKFMHEGPFHLLVAILDRVLQFRHGTELAMGRIPVKYIGEKDPGQFSKEEVFVTEVVKIFQDNGKYNELLAKIEDRIAEETKKPFEDRDFISTYVDGISHAETLYSNEERDTVTRIVEEEVNRFPDWEELGMAHD